MAARRTFSAIERVAGGTSQLEKLTHRIISAPQLTEDVLESEILHNNAFLHSKLLFHKDRLYSFEKL